VDTTAARYHVVKFGGTSVQDHRAIEAVATIVQSNPRGLLVVLSAMAKVTDLLLEATQNAVRGGDYYGAQETFRRRHHDAATALLKDPKRLARIHQWVDQAADELGSICQSLATLREHTQRVLDMTVARGERTLAKLFCELMQERQLDAIYIDATELIVVERQYGSLFPDLDKTAAKVRSLVMPALAKGQLVIVPGYIGTGPDGALVTLGRGGSDLSATVLGHCLQAASVTLYKEVDGLLTADPRHVKEARIVPELHYREAAELAYYGAKILHPRTIMPLLRHQIPLTVRSTFNRELAGTRIAGDVPPGAFPVKALTAVLGQSLIAVEGSGMMGVPGIAARTFAALAQHGISVAVISQASSEANLCFVVPTSEAKAAVSALKEAFAFELERKLIDEIRARDGQAVVAIVGLGMQGTPGIAARAFTALARAGVNVEAIAQGSSELNISVVTEEAAIPEALTSLHREFRLEKLRALPPQAAGEVCLTVYGIGQIGRTLVRQLQSQQSYYLNKMQLSLKCLALIDSSGSFVREHGMTAAEINNILVAKDKGGSLHPASDRRQKKMTAAGMISDLQVKLWQLPVHKGIFIDTTAEDSAAVLLCALQAGWHVAVANKKPLAVPQQQFDELFATATEHGVQLRYEATVGAGLPILDTLAKLQEAGDQIEMILGCFSGTLGYLMTELENGSPFAEAVGRAHSLGFTEPDPREDLSGMDVARKALILARTLGIRMNIEDLAVEPLFPAELSSPDLKVFLQNLRGLDVAWAERIAAARRNHRCIRYVARITPARVTVGLEEVDSDAPLGRLRGTDNQVTITTKRYKQNPLIVSGPGAGAEVTAAGVLNDVLAIALSEGLAVRGRRPQR